MKIKKNNSIQVMRGIAISLVLFRHSIAQVNAGAILKGMEQLIICLHMPVFFVIAGYLFQLKKEKYLQRGRIQFLMGKTRHLLVPYAFWTVLLWSGVQIAGHLGKGIVSKLTEIGFPPMSLKELLFGLLTYEKYYTEHLWFLYVLFVFFLLAIMLGKFHQLWLELGVTFFLGGLTYYVELPQILEKCMLWSIFFVIGKWVADGERAVRGVRKIKENGIFLGITGLFVILCALRLTLGKTVIGTVGVFLLKEAIGILGVWLIFGISLRLKGKISVLFEIIGNYSYDIYLMHNPYFVALSAILLSKVLNVPAGLSAVTAACIGIIIPMILSKYIIQKWKPLCTVMLGR